ncbi:MAG: DUF3795 domain-containing protein [Candidatus Thorarchaeota archaeon]
MSQFEQTIILTNGGFSLTLPNCDLTAPLASLDILCTNTSSAEKNSSSNTETKRPASFIRNSSEQYGHFDMCILLKYAYLLLTVRNCSHKSAPSKDIILKSLHRLCLMRGFRLQLNPCGHVCDICPSYQGKDDRQCSGCPDTKGTPWGGTCMLYECVSSKGVRHCGLCTEFPCDTQVGHFDPSNPSGQQNAIRRTGLLAYWAKHGREKAIELVKKVYGL